MRITETIMYAADPAAVYAMLIDPAFQNQKCVDSGSPTHEVAVTQSGDGATVVVQRDVPTAGFPDIAKRFVGSSLKITETYTWGAAAADGSRNGQLLLEAGGVPVSMRATVTLSTAGEGSRIAIDGDLKCSIPFVGSKIEEAAAPELINSIRSEQVTGERWLAARA